jgi:hypothetical protein
VAVVLLVSWKTGEAVSAQNSSSRSGVFEVDDAIDIHHLPLGDGKISASPRQNYVMSCMTSFRGGGGPRGGGPPGGGARVVGPWIHGDTWDMTQKIAVQGRVTWPQATFRIATEGADRLVSRVIQGNGLPVETVTGKSGSCGRAFLRSDGNDWCGVEWSGDIQRAGRSWARCGGARGAGYLQWASANVRAISLSRAQRMFAE